jgi:hypothetical protein
MQSKPMQSNEWADHHGSHQALLQLARSAPPGRPGLDAIVVPTARHPGHLIHAARLARTLDCPVVTLHSGQSTAAALAWQPLPAGVDLTAIDVPATAHLRLPRLETSLMLSQTVFRRHTDLSSKRNLALMLSRMAGWSRILLLDDDITDLDPAQIRRASGLLDTYHAVGLHINGFPDHSVVCHAHRRVGGDQLSFIGGGALAVRTEDCYSFFPDIYNDDWFFLLDLAGFLQPVTTVGQVCQDSFDPFRTAARARAEELGDVLAEGTYWLLDQGQSVHRANHDHWTEFLDRRKLFIQRVLKMTEEHSLDWTEKLRMIAALRGALSRLARITPELCERYLEAWVSDRRKWQRHIAGLPTGLTCQQALDLLTRPEVPSVTRYLTQDSSSQPQRLSLDWALG